MTIKCLYLKSCVINFYCRRCHFVVIFTWKNSVTNDCTLNECDKFCFTFLCGEYQFKFRVFIHLVLMVML